MIRLTVDKTAELIARQLNPAGGRVFIPGSAGEPGSETWPNVQAAARGGGAGPDGVPLA